MSEGDSYQQQQVGDYYAQQPACGQPPPPACPSTTSAGFHVALPGWSSRRCDATPSYTVPCQQPVVYQQPCAPQQVCDNIGTEMSSPALQQQQGLAPQQQQPDGQQFVQGHYHQQQPQYYAPPPIPDVASSGAEKPPALDLTHKDNRSSRRLVIQIKGSLASFQGDPRRARWELTNEDILKRKITAAVGAKRHGSLQKTVVLDARVLFTSSSAPKSLVAQCSAFRGNTYTDGGVRGFMYVPRGDHQWTGEDGRGIRVMRPNVMVRSTLMSTYGHLDEESLRAPLTKVKGTTFHMVPRNHEIMRIIELNSQKLGLDMSQYQSVCGDQFPVVDPLVENCIGQIKRQVLNMKPWSDMSKGKLVVSLVPADARAGTNSWGCTKCCPGIGSGFVPDRVVNRVVNTPFVVEIWLSLTYAIADRVFVGKDANAQGEGATPKGVN